MDRRSFLGAVAVTMAAHMPHDASASASARAAGARPAVPRSLRVAQLTDTHVFHDLDCPARMRRFLDRFRAVVGTADLVLHTGDVIMDALDHDRDDVAKQWALWHELARELPAPPRYVIGNHDVWGRGPSTDPRYGKQWAVDALKLPHRYYSFTQAGWRFIVLDSVQPRAAGGWYSARLDPEQVAWLEDELAKAAAATPVAIVSHIPIVSAAILDWATPQAEAWTVGDGLLHADSHAVQAILRRHPNVKLCLSGHLHLLDRLVYDGITYLGCGAVAGDWWKRETFHQTRCGFAVIDLYADGSFERTYHAYDWATASASASRTVSVGFDLA